MPIYEYVCDACGQPTEALRKLSDPPLRECPACHADALVKVMSAPHVGGSTGGYRAADPPCAVGGGGGGCGACGDPYGSCA